MPARPPVDRDFPTLIKGGTIVTASDTFRARAPMTTPSSAS